jgi:P-type Cu2+ transporter
MGCCTGIASAAVEQASLARREELRAAARPGPDGRPQLTLSAPDIRCGLCIATIERALGMLPEVASARVNLTARRVTVTLAG